MLPGVSLRCRPATGSPTMRKPSRGTFSISMRPSAPTKRISVEGLSSTSLRAIDTAGKICPPVPPPLIITRSLLYSIFV